MVSRDFFKLFSTQTVRMVDYVAPFIADHIKDGSCLDCIHMRFMKFVLSPTYQKNKKNREKKNEADVA